MNSHSLSKKVSVVIPYYGHEKYIIDSIESVLNQDYNHIELIVVNDGSPCQMHERLKLHSVNFNYKYFRKDNGGISSAINYGIEKSSGLYLAFLGCDDRMLPSRISKQVSYLEKNLQCSVCTSFVERIDADGNYLNSVNPKHGECLGFDYFFNNRYYFPSPATMYRRTLFEQVGGFDKNSDIEDWEFLLRVTYEGHNLAVLPEILTQYRIHNSMSSNSVRMYKGIIFIARKYKRFHKKYYSIILFQYIKYCKRAVKDKSLSKLMSLTNCFFKALF